VAWALTDPKDRDIIAIDAAINLMRVLFFTATSSAPMKDVLAEK
jgi:hypothetical protein